MHISPIADRLGSFYGVVSGRDENMALSSLENKLFDSVEFCLALLGMIPVPLFIVNKDGSVIPLSAGRNTPGDELICSHVSNGGKWTVSDKPTGCVFCDTVVKARISAKKVAAKGEWTVSSPDGQTTSLIVTIHAAPAKIKDEDMVFVAVEDQTEVEKLRGLLPICMECNKIHDHDTGRWVRIDQYVTDRSAARFSHGLCPDCAERLLKEIDGN